MKRVKVWVGYLSHDVIVIIPVNKIMSVIGRGLCVINR